MNKRREQRRFKQVFVSRSMADSLMALIYSITSITSFISAGWIASAPFIPPVPKIRATLAQETCLDALANIGFSVSTQENGSIVASQALISGPMASLTSSSLGVLTCQGYQLTEFCAGPECTNSAIQLTLSPK